MAELKRRVEPALRLAQAGLPGRILGRLVEVGFLDRTVILAGQAFSAVLPLFMVVSAVSPQPGGDSLATTMARRLGLDPSNVSSLQSAVAVSTSAYYAWSASGDSGSSQAERKQAELVAEIRMIHRQSGGTYGRHGCTPSFAVAAGG